ncbi:MAG: transcription antitermination factor NusB [Deltaproteobacteria bacterium]|jgi:N utilization substance protein B|nr:transcription antitermination factor NusB [Deltaproteobacteria bacterium]
MGARTKAREAALQLVYQVELGGERSPEAMELFWTELPTAGETVRRYGSQLATAALEHQEEIDAMVSGAAENWDIQRIARVDLCLLRVALGEMIYVGGTPVAVVINEAVEVAKRFCDTASPAFVNGVLDSVAVERKLLEKKDGKPA